MVEPIPDDLLDTCSSYLDLQRCLLNTAAANGCPSPATLVAMDAALDQLETAVHRAKNPASSASWWEPDGDAGQ